MVEIQIGDNVEIIKPSPSQTIARLMFGARDSVGCKGYVSDIHDNRLYLVKGLPKECTPGLDVDRGDWYSADDIKKIEDEKLDKVS